MPNKNKKPVKKSAPKGKAPKAPNGKSKTPAKSAVKPHAKPAKAALRKSSPAKALPASGSKSLGKDQNKADAKALGLKKKAAPIPIEVKAPKKEKTAKKDKKKKNAKEGVDLEEDDLLASDEEMGSEEIPDLSEFDENEMEEVEIEEDSLEESEVTADMKPADDEIVLTDAEGRRYCRVRDCDQISAVEGYCRFHYLLLWKKIQVRRKILADGKLERYVEELTSRYPDKFLEMIRKDLRTEKDFLGAIAELEIDESAGENEFEDEAQSYVDEIRGMTTDSGSMSDEEEF